MKRVGKLFDKVCDFDNLLRAYKRAFRASGRTPAACEFCFRLEKEILQLQRELLSGEYQPAPYRYFRISDPKARIISVADFRDRVVHHALVGVLEPVFERRFIYDSYATRKNKGTHKAILRAQSFIRKNFFFLKTDIAKYFDSIDHNILLALISRKIKDKDILALTETILRNSDESRGMRRATGLPIGNLTSQFFANVYLDPLDHFIKDERGVKYYIRYMDDMALFSEDKGFLKEILAMMRDFLKEKLKLELKQSATFINTRIHGIPFLGFRIFPKLKRIKSENLRRFRQRLRQRQWEMESGRIAESAYGMSLQSLVAHLKFGDTMQLRKEMRRVCADFK